MKALFCKEQHCNRTKILSLCQTMLVIGLAVRDGKNLGQVHRSEIAWDAISFITAFSGICIQQMLCSRSGIAGVVAGSWERNRAKYGDVGGGSTASESNVMFLVDLCLQLAGFKGISR